MFLELMFWLRLRGRGRRNFFREKFLEGSYISHMEKLTKVGKLIIFDYGRAHASHGGLALLKTHSFYCLFIVVTNRKF